MMKAIELVALVCVFCSCVTQVQQAVKPKTPAPVASPVQQGTNTPAKPSLPPKGDAATPPAPCTLPLAAVKDLNPPVLSAEECDPIHAAQVKVLGSLLSMEDAQDKLNKAVENRNQATAELSKANEAAKKRIGPGWDINSDTTATVKVEPQKAEDPVRK